MNVRCPHCGHKFAGEAELAGLEVHCPSCGESLTLPAGPGEPSTSESDLLSAPSGGRASKSTVAPSQPPTSGTVATPASSGRRAPQGAAPSQPPTSGAKAKSAPSGRQTIQKTATPPGPPASKAATPSASGAEPALPGTARKKSEAETHIKFECSHCHQRLSVPAAAAGLMGKCPNCNNRVQAPEFRKTERQAWEETDPTNPHFLKSLGIGVTLLLLWFGLLLPFNPPPETPIGDYSTMQFIASLFYKHFTVSLLNTLFFTWSISIIFLKQRKIRLQKAALLLDVLPTELGKKIHAGNVAEFIDHVYSLPIALRDSLMVNRIRKALELFEIRQNVSDVREMMVSQSEIDSARIAGSYTLVRAFLWGIPLLGFIGTVVGLSHAIGGMSFANVDDVGKVVAAINNVTGGLGTAFDATLLGLVLALTLNFPLNALAKQEEDNLHTIDAFCNEVLLPRLKDASPAHGTDATAIAHAVARAISGTQEKLLEDLNQLAQQMNSYAENLDRRMQAFQETVTQEFVTKTAEMRAQNQAAMEAALEQLVNSIVNSQEAIRGAAAAQSDEVRAQTDRALKESLEQAAKCLESIGNATAAKNDDLRDQTDKVLKESSEQIAKYLGGLEAGIGGLNKVLSELGEKQVVIAPPKRRRWFARN